MDDKKLPDNEKKNEHRSEKRSLNVSFHCKLEDRDRLLSDKNAAIKCSGVYLNPNPVIAAFFFPQLMGLPG